MAEPSRGWYAIPRSYGTMWPGGPTVRSLIPELPADYEEQAEAHPAHWEVAGGAIEGFQDPDTPGYGGYLASEKTYADFELVLEMNPDWPADAGVMIRRRPDSWAGFQVLVDYRKSGSIGGFFGDGTGGFHDSPLVTMGVVEITGTEGTLVVPDPNRFTGEVKITRAPAFAAIGSDPDWQIVPVTGVLAGRGIGVLDMARSIRTGSRPLASGKLAYHVLDTLMAIDEAIATTRTVEINSSVDAIPLVAEDWDPFAATLEA